MEKYRGGFNFIWFIRPNLDGFIRLGNTAIGIAEEGRGVGRGYSVSGLAFDLALRYGSNEARDRLYTIYIGDTHHARVTGGIVFTTGMMTAMATVTDGWRS